MPPQGMELILKSVLGLIVFACLLFLAYITTKYVGQKSLNSMRSGHMQVIETLSLGFDKCIYLVKVEEKYILIASAGKSIEFLTEVDISHIEETNKENVGQSDFYSMFLNYVKKMTAADKISTTEVHHQDSHNASVVRNVSKLKDSLKRFAGNDIGKDENINE
jgi:flagellar protein FliO/FliZ